MLVVTWFCQNNSDFYSLYLDVGYISTLIIIVYSQFFIIIYAFNFIARYLFVIREFSLVDIIIFSYVKARAVRLTRNRFLVSFLQLLKHAYNAKVIAVETHTKLCSQ